MSVAVSWMATILLCVLVERLARLREDQKVQQREQLELERAERFRRNEEHWSVVQRARELARWQRGMLARPECEAREGSISIRTGLRVRRRVGAATMGRAADAGAR